MAEKNAPLPQPWGVLYANPNPDGSKKSCLNCMMWVREGKCVIHSKDESVTEEMICGYHVFGEPMAEWMDHPGMQPVEPTSSGLDTVPGGTSCDTCKYFEDHEGEGECYAVTDSDGNTPVSVNPLACCARWEKGGEETMEDLLKQLSRTIGAVTRGKGF